MKLLMSNSKNINLLAPQYASSLRKMGIQVYDYLQSDYGENFNLVDRIIHRFYPDYFYKKINNHLVKLISEIKPDILLIFKGMETYPETLKKIKKNGIKLVNYNADHPFEYVSRGSGNANVFKSITLFDHHITYSHKIANEFKIKYPSIDISIIPFGFALSDEDYDKIILEPEIKKVCFVGYADKERADFIQFLLDKNISVDVYGDKWDKYYSNRQSNLKVYKSVSGLEYFNTLRKYRVQLNLFRQHNEDSHNMRSFEVPASGGIMLAPNSFEHRLYFEDLKEVVLYDSKEDAFQKIKYLLSMSSEEANILRNNARSRSVNSNYSYDGRAKQLYSLLSNELKK